MTKPSFLHIICILLSNKITFTVLFKVQNYFYFSLFLKIFEVPYLSFIHTQSKKGKPDFSWISLT